MNSKLTLDSIYKASYVLKNVVRKTGVIYAPKLKPDTELYLKTTHRALLLRHRKTELRLQFACPTAHRFQKSRLQRATVRKFAL